MIVILFSILEVGSPAFAQTSQIRGTPSGFNETGTPAFVVLGAEALGMSAPPVDLQQLPDGRLLAMGQGEISIGDGVRWEVFRQSADDARVDTQSVAIDSTGQIYGGIQGGFGRVEFRQNGTWHFVMQQKLPAEFPSDMPVLRNVTVIGNEWFWWFGSGPVIAWHPGSTPRLVGTTNAVESIFALEKDIFLSDQSNGDLFLLENGKSNTFVRSGSHYVAAAITRAIQLDEHRYFLGTANEGVQLYENGAIRPFMSSGLLADKQRVNDLCVVGKNQFAAALDNIGLVFFDGSGRIIQVLDRSVDNRFSRIKRLFRMSGGMVWALLNDGIARIEFPGRISYYDSLIPTGLTFSQPFRYQGKLWLMADGFAQRAEYDANHRLLRFVVDSPRGYMTSMVEVDGIWMASSQAGLFSYDEVSHWTLVDNNSPISPHVRSKPVEPGRWLYAAENEVGWLLRREGKFTFERIPVPNLGHVYGSIEDNEGVFWVELGNQKVARITPTLPQPTVEVLSRDQGVPEGWAQLFKIHGVVRLNIPWQILKYNSNTKRMEIDTAFLQEFPALQRADGRPVMDTQGRIWATITDKLQVLAQHAPANATSQEFIPVELHPYHMTPQDDGVVWLNQRMHVARFDPNVTLPAKPPLRALITRLEFPLTDRTLYSVGDSIPAVAYSDNSLIVHYVAPDSPLGQPISFDVQLEGSGKGWLSASNTGAMTFNHLLPGEYRLRVRPRIGDEIGTDSAVRFIVLAPWYRSTLAYALYVASVIAMILFAAWLSAYVNRREKLRLENLVAIRTRELQATNTALGLQIADSLRKTEALKVSEDRYRRLSDNAPDIIFRLIVEPEMAFDYVSPAVARITGFQPEEFLSDPCFPQKIVEPRGSETVCDFAMSKQVPLDVRTVQWRTRDGRIVTIEERLSPTYDATGRLLTIEGIARDITQTVEDQERRKRLEAQLMQSQKLESVGTLAGGIAHDFNNILMGILGYCELALQSPVADKALLNDLQMIKAAGMRAKNLVAQILTFSRKSESRLEVINLATVVKEALQLIRATTPATIAIVSDCVDGQVLADATQIHQIVINLCTNAIHAMRDRPGKLAVSVRQVNVDTALVEELPNLVPGLCMCLSVSDTGHGMDAATLARSFDPFFTTKKPGEGTGLGLSAVQGIVATHNGGLRVRSEVNVGTTFDIYFPCTQQIVPTAPTSPAPTRGQQQHILIVDDEQPIVDFISTVLRHMNYQVTVFNHPQAAFSCINQRPHDFHAIVTDMTMPHLTGLELINQIRTLGVTIPAIIITGYSEEISTMHQDSLENITVLGKPFSGEELTQVLARALKQES